MDWLLLAILLVGGLTAASLVLLLIAPMPAGPPRDEAAADVEWRPADSRAPCRHDEHDAGG